MASPRFWQHLLALELPAFQAEKVAQDCLNSPLDPLQVLRNHPALTMAVRRRMDHIDSRALESALQQGARVLEISDEPRIASVAPAVFCLGETDFLNGVSIGIVGTRSASAYGKACAQKFAERFASQGVTIVSGGAMGIDTAAHKGALAVGGRTAVVLPCGIEQTYPAVNRQFFSTVRQSKGTFFSQFAPGHTIRDQSFINRNALIAALSDAVVVVEAPEKSGALRTASVANEFGKQVFVVPSQISHHTFKGSHGLIRDGATLVDHPDQVLAALNLEVRAITTNTHSPEVQAILEALGEGVMDLEKLTDATGIEPPELLTILTDLELDGLVFRDTIGYSIK